MKKFEKIFNWILALAYGLFLMSFSKSNSVFERPRYYSLPVDPRSDIFDFNIDKWNAQAGSNGTITLPKDTFHLQGDRTDPNGATAFSSAVVNLINPFEKPSVKTSKHYFQWPLSQDGKWGQWGVRDTTFVSIVASKSSNAISTKWNVIGSTMPIRFVDSLADSTSIWTKQAGEVLLRVTVYSLTDSASDTLQIQIKDYENCTVHGCRVGPPHTFVIDGSSTFDLVYEQLAKTLFKQTGEYPLGGDIVRVKKNKNNGGVWRTWRLGGISGCDTANIHIRLYDSAVKITTPQLACCSDSSVMRFFDIEGSGAVDGDYYGFQVDNPKFNLTAGIATYLASNFDISRWYLHNTATGVFFKVDQNTSKPVTWDNNFVYHNIHFHHSMIDTTGNGEGTYIGPTDKNGFANGHTHGISSVRNRGVEIDHLVVIGTYRDGIQSTGDSSIEHDNWIYDIGLHNEGQQRFNQDVGGFGSKIYNNVNYLGREGFGVFSHGTNSVYNNWSSRNRTGGVKGNSADVQVIPEKCCGMTGSVFIEDHNQWRGWYDIHDNIFEGGEAGIPSIKITDPHSAISPDTPSLVRNNLFVDSTGRTVTTLISNVQGTTYNTNNTVFNQRPIQIFNLSNKHIGPRFMCYDPVTGRSATFTEAADAIQWRRDLLIPHKSANK